MYAEYCYQMQVAGNRAVEVYRVGWLCPRCNAANGPHVDHCACSAAAGKKLAGFRFAGSGGSYM
jgi:hypothetical protein